MTDLHAVSGAYAVDALDDLERARFERHLAGCGDCRTEVAELRDTAAHLSASVSVAPPPQLRAHVLAAVSTVRPLPPDLPVAQAARRRWWPLLTVAALLVLVVAVGAVWQPLGDDRAPSATDRVLAADDAAEVPFNLDGSDLRVVLSKSEGRAVMVAKDLSAAPAGMVYALWLMGPDGVITPAGLVEGAGDQTVLMDGDATNATWAGVTVEPAGGSPQPTTEPIATFDLTTAA